MTGAVDKGEFGHGDEWFTSDGQSQDGPFTGDTIVRAALEGKLRGSDYLWKAGMPTWVPVRDLIDIRPPAPPNSSALPPTSSQFPAQAHAPAVAADTQPASNSKPPVGLAGWLTLVSVQLICSVVFTIPIEISEYSKFNELPITSNIRTPLLILTLALFVLGILYPLILLSKFFGKITNFPRHYITWIWLITASPLLYASLIDVLRSKDGPRELIFIAMSAVWTSYMLRSKRVKATFVRTSSWIKWLGMPTIRQPATEPPK